MRRSPLTAALLTALLMSCLHAAAAAGGDGKQAGKSRPDFSGKWELDRAKSDFGLFSDRPLSKAESLLDVVHRDPELRIARTLRLNGREEVKEFLYYTDERGETNQAAFGAGELKSRTKWDGGRVTSHAKTTWPARDGRPAVELETTQRWQLSSDGKALTHTTVIVNDKVTEEMKMVYRRAG